MIEAARTTATTGATWAIVIVAVSVLAFWLTAMFLADRSQVRASGRARPATWPSYQGAWTGGSVAGAEAPEIPEQAAHEPIVPEGEAPTRADIPVQRSGDADRAERSYAGPTAPDEEDQGR
jgi:hypothetical protein